MPFTTVASGLLGVVALTGDRHGDRTLPLDATIEVTLGPNERRCFRLEVSADRYAVVSVEAETSPVPAFVEGAARGQLPPLIQGREGAFFVRAGVRPDRLCVAAMDASVGGRYQIGAVDSEAPPEEQERRLDAERSLAEGRFAARDRTPEGFRRALRRQSVA